MPEETKKLLEELESEKKVAPESQASLDGEVIEEAGVEEVEDIDEAESEAAEFDRRRKELKENVQAKELIDTEISPEMREAYLNYAMSVIVGRALPNAEDGLKPVHRRILWAMHKMGVAHNKQTKKSARIVGDTMGKYHPHGNVAIYDAMVRMAQPWSLRYPLVLGQGNFGSMDGDNAAADRYTEAKMQKITAELLDSIEKRTVEMRPNYSNEEEEPVLLPGKIPNLLLNGASGIAVGMATNIPPHNMNNVCDTVLHYIDEPGCEIKDLIKIIKAPDFPTGGTVSGQFKQVYEEGKGRMIIDGKVDIEEPKGKAGKLKIIITEIPYQVNKSSLVEQIADLTRDKKLPDVSDIRDESSKGKVRIVVELRKGTDAQFTINRLYKYTSLRTSFNANMLALVGQKPKVMNLKEFITVYVDHRRSVIRKEKEFDLDKAEKRIHIVEGLLIAQGSIDEVIRLIRASKAKAEALEVLMKKYTLSQKQGEAILDMKLSQLTSLEHDKLRGEEKELKELIEKLNKILGNETEILSIIKKDLLEIKEKYGDKRRTRYGGQAVEDFDEKDLVKKKDVVVTITDKDYIKRIDVEQYKEQKRGGKGVIGSDLTDGDFVKELLTCSTHDYLLFFTDKGKVHWLKAHHVPESAKTSKGKAVINLLDIKDEKVTSVISVKKFEDYLMMATGKGVVKRIELSSFASPRKGGIKAIKVAETDDTLIDVKKIKAKQEVLLVTKLGQAIRFNSEDVRSMGRASYGVTGIKMNKGDEVVSLEVLPLKNKADHSILTITEKGYGKRSSIVDYRLTGRAGKGVINMKVTDKTGNIIKSTSVVDEDNVIVTTHNGIVIRMPLKNIRVMGRATQGVRIINLKDDDTIGDLTRVPKDDTVEGIEEVNKELESSGVLDSQKTL
ncbi:DNA gyrase subunit A [archaeon]|nr:DNA gyrase subunit A [archaeon]